MPFPRPTLSDLRTDVAADFAAALPGADALLRFSNLGVLAKGQAGLAHGHYGYLDYIARQATPFTATDEYLEGWAGLKGVIRKASTGAMGSATFTGTNGVPIPSGSPVTRNDGIRYATSADGTISAGSVTVPIIAIDLGIQGNADAGVALTLGIAIAGVSPAGSATGAITGGADVEDDDALRSRMLQVYAAPPQGGSRLDYVEWALEVPGITRCWVTANGMGPGTVVLYFMMDEAEAAHGGFPQGTNGAATLETGAVPATGDQLALANALWLRKQPAHIIVYAVAPTANTLNFTIAGLSGASAAVKTAISTAITGALLRNAVPGGSTNVSAIEGAIAAVAGSAGFVITAITASAGTVSPGAAGNIVSNAGALPVLGMITWS